MELRVDADANAGYVSISQAAVARTEPFGESVLIDVGDADELVGIELLTLNGVVVDVDGICMRYDLPDTIRAGLHHILGGKSA